MRGRWRRWLRRCFCMNIKDYNDLFAILTAIGTIGMCLCSFLNIRFTRKQATYQSKIIDTKNLLYGILASQRSLLFEDVKNRIIILEYFICLFLLKKERTNDGNFKCFFEFEDKQTTFEEKKIIENCFYYLFFIYNHYFSTWQEAINNYHNLIKIIECYLGEDKINKNMSCNGEKMKFSKYVLGHILKGSIFILDNTIDLKKNDEKHGDMFYKYVNYRNAEFLEPILKNHYDTFRYFYVPTYEEILNAQPHILIPDILIADIRALPNALIDILIDKNSIKTLSEEYNLLCNRLKDDIDAGVVAKISSDFQSNKFYYLPEKNFITRIWLMIKKKYYFRKINKSTPCLKERFKNPMNYEIKLNGSNYVSLILKKNII